MLKQKEWHCSWRRLCWPVLCPAVPTASKVERYLRTPVLPRRARVPPRRKTRSRTLIRRYANSAAGFEARAEEFMSQRSDIKVEVQGIPANSWGELMQAISVNIAGGDVPDIADIASEGQRSFAASGIIIPIDKYLERDKEEMKETLDEIDPALMETMKYDGKTYCLPTVWNNILLYYNKNVLERFNIPEPESGWTIDDLSRSARL